MGNFSCPGKKAELFFWKSISPVILLFSLMNLVIDLGNTYGKAALFDGEQMVSKYEKLPPEEIVSLARMARPENSIICSVSSDPAVLREKIVPYTHVALVLSHQLPVPVTNRYETPQTLGMDRLAAVVGATVRFPKQHCLSIDLGTCITYDLIDEEGSYYGGSISPGLQMRFQAMHTFTARLPLMEAEPTVKLIGGNTRAAMQSGVVYGVTAELEGMIGYFAGTYQPLTTILCGVMPVF